MTKTPHGHRKITTMLSREEINLALGLEPTSSEKNYFVRTR